MILRRPTPTWLALLFTTLLLPSLTNATHSHALEKTQKPRLPRPIDEVQADLAKKHKSPRARELNRAYLAFKEKEFGKAIQLAEGAKRKTRTKEYQEFADYSYWIAAQAHLGNAKTSLEAKSYAEAIKSSESSAASALRIETHTPYSPMIKGVARDVGMAELIQGDAQAGSKKWGASIASFDRGFQRLSLANSLNIVRPESLLHYAQACSRVKTDLCEAWVGRFVTIYPKSSPEMQAVLKVLPKALERPKPALRGKLTQAYKATDLDQAAFEANMALYLDGKFKQSIQGFQRFGDEFPKSTYRFRARFWLAQSLNQEQEHDKAQKTYGDLQKDSPLTYYGMLAAFSAGLNLDTSITQVTPLALERDPYLLPNEVTRLERAEKFLAENANELALIELKELRARDALSSPFLMYLAALNAAAGSHSTAFTILGELVSRGYDGATSASFLNLVFPAAHFELIKKHADHFNLDPLLVLSLIKQESAFDPGAGSNVGATGLMQLMPATATDTDPNVERSDLIDPDTNIRVGTQYLKQVLNKFNGNIVLALAGYNAGPHNVDRWLKDSGGKRGMIEFIETIPFKETREYVGSIIRNYYWYSRKLMPLEPVKPLNYFWGIQGPAIKASPAAMATVVPVSAETQALPSPEPLPVASPSVQPE